MKALLDLNVLLDVFQDREPFYLYSSRVVNAAVTNKFEAVVSAHFLTTLDYVLTRHASRSKAREAVGWVLASFSVASVDQGILRRAYDMGMSDFEDAVSAAVAEAQGCAFIVTRNETDFVRSQVPAIRPEEFSNTLSQS